MGIIPSGLAAQLTKLRILLPSGKAYEMLIALSPKAKLPEERAGREEERGGGDGGGIEGGGRGGGGRTEKEGGGEEGTKDE